MVKSIDDRPSNTYNHHPFAVKPRTIALKTTPHLPKLSIKLELKPEHHNAAFYENNQPEEDEEEDGIGAEEDADGDGSNSHISEQSTSQSDQFGSMGSSSAGAITLATPTPGSNSNSSSSVGGTSSNKTMVKKSSISKSPAPPTVGRKATSYIAVST